MTLSSGHPLFRRLRSQWLPLLAVVVVGLALWAGRRQYIRSWFVRGPADRTLVNGRPGRSERGPVRPVRVVLIDGLSEAVARSLPALSRCCRAGVTLRVNVGFPSVSLPVQHALWTGAWQNQSGVLFEVQRMQRPVFESLPEMVVRRGGSAAAVAESHREIAESLAFANVVAPDGLDPAPFSAETLRGRALDAVRSSAALVLVHILAVDEAGHEWGAAHQRYREAAGRSDRLVDTIWQTRLPAWTLLVLSDHGHLDRGGHGGTEPDVGWVRACLVGPGIPAGRSGTANIVDLNRVLADSLGVGAPAAGQGRPLDRLLDATAVPPQPGSFRPGLITALGLLASLVMVALVVCRWRSETPSGQRGDAVGLATFVVPWGIACSVLLLLLALGPPSLSRSYVYRIWHGGLLACWIPAWLAPGLQLWLAVRKGWDLSRVIVCQLLLVLVAPAVIIALTNWPVTCPPLVPHLSAWGSTLLSAGAISVLALAFWGTILGGGRG